jgi:alkyldihydroxyacetonephosphate synthase
MRLQDVPRFRASATARFEGLSKAAEAVRAIAQSGLNPANCRLIDAQEAALNGSGDGRHDLLVLGFESADHPQDARLARAAELVRDHGGIIDPAGEGARPEAAEAWRNAFIRAPYYRELRIPHGIIADTFETACLWSDFEAFHAGITSDVRRILKQATGREGSVTCRFTHVYPDGPAPYFTFHAVSDPAGMLDAWRDIKLAINEVVVGRGGTVTHHHAVGRDHRHWGYDRERPALFAEALMAAKQRLDPAGILNPGVLIDAPGKTNGGRGVLAG